MKPYIARYYLQGYEAKKEDINPYSPKGNLAGYHAWSAGHWDKHGNVEQLHKKIKS